MTIQDKMLEAIFEHETTGSAFTNKWHFSNAAEKCTEIANQEKIVFAVEILEELKIEAGLMSTSSQKQKKIESKLTELKSLQK